MKIINAIPEIGPMSESEVEKFLESKLNIQLATIDDAGDPVIQPVWFYYDKDTKKIYVETRNFSKKVQNIRSRPKVYFSIDDETFPYKGVKGKGVINISQNPGENIPIVEKINLKYLGTLDHPLAQMLLENARNGTGVVLEINPQFFSTWDFGKM